MSWSSGLNISPQSIAVVCNLAVTVFWPTHDRLRGMRDYHKLTIFAQRMSSRLRSIGRPTPSQPLVKTSSLTRCVPPHL